jgi:acetoin:2,6-dichlorophenolindophenol oxidoreductase subunit alpha
MSIALQSLDLYRAVARARAFELTAAELWRQGLISGELHLGTGEEAIAAGIAAHLQGGDAVALDHRGTPLLTALGIDLKLVLKELLGQDDGLCKGRGGHMHLFVPKPLCASSGIVGASAPTGAGFALAAKLLRPGSIGLAFFGDGAMNQGMLLEALNLAVAWKLPAIFVCKDNQWAITTRSERVTGGDLLARAKAFGLAAIEVDGQDALAVFQAAAEIFPEVRAGKGPAFLLARCARLDGHLLGDPLVRTAKEPIGEGKGTIGRVVAAAFTSGGGGVGARALALTRTVNLLRLARKDKRDSKNDPVTRLRKVLAESRTDLDRIDDQIETEMAAVVQAAVGGDP